MLTCSCNGRELVDRKVFIQGEVDLRVCNVIIIELSCVKDVSFGENLPDISSSVFNVADVSGIKLIGVGFPGVTPPNERWEWGWDWRCHDESFGLSKSLS